MAHDDEPLVLLGRALDQVSRLIRGTAAGQADLPTPCRSWTVRQLIGHLVTDLDNFAAAVRGEKPDWSRPPSDLGTDWAAAYAAGRGELDSAWSHADVQAAVPTLTGGEAPLLSRAGQQIAELAVHGWDLARATHQREDFDPAVAEHGLRWAMENLKPQFRGPEDEGKAFGPEVAVPADAPSYDRLAGWFGRDPQWKANG